MDYKNIPAFVNILNKLFDTDLTKNAYAYDITYDDFSTVLLFQYLTEPYEHVKINIVNTNSPDTPCLDLKIIPYDGKLVGKISFIRTLSDSIGGISPKCKIPDSKAGTWLINLSKKMLCYLGINHSTLEDDSQLLCDKNNVKIKFLLLRLFQKKKFISWYETFGYNFNFNTSRVQNKFKGYDKEQFNKDISLLSNIKMSDIIEVLIEDDLPKIPSSLPTSQSSIVYEDIDNVIEILEKYPPTKDMTLADYMVFLWEKNCEYYTLFEKLLNTTSRPDITKNTSQFFWDSLYDRIKFVTYDLSNNDTCK